MGMIIVLLNLSVLAAGVTLLARAWPELRSSALRWMSLLVFSFCIISFCTLIVYVQTDFEQKVFFSRMRFLTFGFLAPVWMLFLSSTFKRWNWLQKIWVQILLLSVPVVTTTLTALPWTREWIVLEFAPFSKMGLSVVSYVNGAWFPVHYGWSTLWVAVSWIFGFSICRSLKGQKRFQLIILTFGSLLGALLDFIMVGTGSDFRWLMASSATYLFTEGALFYTVFKHRLLDISPAAKEKIFRDFPDPVIILDDEQCLRDLSASAEQVFGLSREDRGTRIDLLIPSLSLKSGEAWLRDKDTESRFFMIHVESLLSGGFDAGSLIVLREITMQKKAEDQLAQSLELKTRLMALISHDLTDCLESQYEYSMGLNDKEFALPLRDRLLALNNSMSVSKGLLANLLAWSKDQGSDFRAQRRSFEMNSLIRSVVEGQQIKADFKSIRIDLQSDSEVLLMMTDTLMVESIVRNILSNAIRASHTGKTITLALRATTEKVHLKVTDQGVGMTSEQLSNILQISDRFFVDSGPRTERQGLGLSIARKFMESLGGVFAIESRVDVGTEVSLEIPIDINARHL
ncbi:Histidine protein kinase DivJ [compost metagenome]